MKNFPPHRRKFKKKIALLLRDVLAESRDFAKAYAAAVERSSGHNKTSQPSDSEVLSERKVEVFTAETDKFKEAVEKIAPELLDILNSQLASTPDTLFVNGISEDKKRQTTKTSAVEDENTMRIFEEEYGD